MPVRFFTSLLLSSFIFVSIPANAYFSNDPQGRMFIQKPFGDMNNCGPLSALMLTKFVKPHETYKNLNDEIDKARRTVQVEDEEINYRWWSFRDIKKFLRHNNVSYSEMDTAHFRYAQSRSSKIVKTLIQGNVVVINIDMNDLPRDSEVGKYYTTTSLFGRWGHFLVIVGYKKVNGQLAYEIHDSHSAKGKNRFFYAKHINHAITKYNKKLLLVNKTSSHQDIFSSYFK